jgi:hypothetical protein
MNCLLCLVTFIRCSRQHSSQNQCPQSIMANPTFLSRQCSDETTVLMQISHSMTVLQNDDVTDCHSCGLSTPWNNNMTINLSLVHDITRHFGICYTRIGVYSCRQNNKLGVLCHIISVKSYTVIYLASNSYKKKLTSMV